MAKLARRLDNGRWQVTVVGRLEASGDLEAACQAYRLAADAYGGELLPEERYEEWVMSERAALEAEYHEVLARLNKRMTLDAFRRATDFLHRHDIALRVFVLLSPPFTPADEAVEWACRSIDLGAECGATACSVIPTRGGNGAMEALGNAFTPPRLAALEAVIEYGLVQRRAGPFGPMRVFADLLDIERFFSCACSPAHAARLAAMNREQRVTPRVVCECAQT